MTDLNALSLHLGGPFAARVGPSPVAGLSRRAQALLAYLSLQPDMRAERGLLADLLWSDRAEEQARASLRQELAVLRKALPDDLLQANRQFVWLDAARVRLVPGPGDFLQGFDLASEGFEDWLRDRRAHPAVPAPSPAAASAAAARTQPSLAVLPFEELGAGSGDMFADGVVEEITGALSRVHDFHVIARQSAFALPHPLPVPEAARQLGADYVVEGSVRRAGDRVRIAVQLVNGADGRTLWSERFDDRLDDLFALQDRIAAQVAGQIAPRLRHAEIDRIAAIPPGDRTAYGLVLLALPHFWAHTRRGNTRALAILDQSLVADPDYGPALAYKAWALAQQVTYVWSDDPEGDRHATLGLTRRAAAHVGDHAPSLVALGAAVSLSSDDIALADSYIDRALAIDPNNAWGWLRRGWSRNYAGATDEARACFDRAEALSPLDPFLFNIVFGRAGSYLTDARYPEAVVQLRRGIALAPTTEWAWRLLAVVHVQLGEMDEARAAMARLLEANPGMTLRRVVASIPRSIFDMQPGYVDALRAAGMPEG
ncbi:MAG: tetratricopeptide repeat protein [Rhodobacteraceae bacterium]|nr:tetratricopeptide repeat protein [Paracoccaceae bacterium]